MSEEHKNLEFDTEVEQETSIGEIKISSEVISVIASSLTSEVEGIAAMSGGIAEGIVQAFGRKTPAKGVKVEMEKDTVAIDLYVIVKYGARIPEVSWSIQEKVKSGIEQMTGLKVKEINIHVQGIDFSKEKESKDVKETRELKDNKEFKIKEAADPTEV